MVGLAEGVAVETKDGVAVGVTVVEAVADWDGF